LMVKPGLINLDFADVRAVMREMGKAMMGTGEASGEKRALAAAEAAIANPLLDEVSMKGAKGLLISITGGKDMMLYELDEAATRIREEVDPEANIILGATQDDSLEGIIRVSVVATGIDRASIDAIEPVKVLDQRLAEMAQRLRTQIAAKTAGEPVIPLVRAPVAASVAAEPAVEAVIEAAPAVETMHEAAPVYQPQHATAATSTSTAAIPAPAVIAAPVVMEVAPAPVAAPRIYDEYAVVPQTRMPRIEDFPVVAQAQLRSAQIPPQPVASAETKRMTLLQRLAAVGLGRRDEPNGVPDHGPAEAQAPVAALPVETPRRPVVQAPPRAAQGQLDSHGRTQSRSIEDDQLEIPAFLRRQG
jgi:cell division protein FtsZ